MAVWKNFEWGQVDDAMWLAGVVVHSTSLKPSAVLRDMVKHFFAPITLRRERTCTLYGYNIASHSLSRSLTPEISIHDKSPISVAAGTSSMQINIFVFDERCAQHEFDKLCLNCISANGTKRHLI